jgi:hypothetical protein
VADLNYQEQHDDHVWVVVRGESWAIRAIDREPMMVVHLWRGYEPDLEYSSIGFYPDYDWGAYCAAAVKLLRRMR